MEINLTTSSIIFGELLLSLGLDRRMGKVGNHSKVLELESERASIRISQYQFIPFTDNVKINEIIVNI